MLGLRPTGFEFRILCMGAVPSHSSHYPQEVLLAQFGLYVHKSGLKPDSFHFPSGDLAVVGHVGKGDARKMK